MAQHHYRDSNYYSKSNLKHKDSCNVDNDIGNLHHLLESTFEETFLSSDLRKDGFSKAGIKEKSRSDKSNKAFLINCLTKDDKMVNEEVKRVRKKCKHKCDKDKSRKNLSSKEIQSSKRIDSHESYYKSKSNRFSNSNQNVNYNQERVYRRSHNDDRYKSYYYCKKNFNYAYDYRYTQQSGSVLSKRDKSRSRAERDMNLRFDQQKILEAAKRNLSKMIEQNELPPGFDVKRKQFRHLHKVSDQKSIQNFTQFCKIITEQESQSNSSFGEADFDHNSDSDEIKSNTSSECLKNHWKIRPVKEVHKSKPSNNNVQSEVNNHKTESSLLATQSLHLTEIKQPFEINKEPNFSDNLNKIFTRIRQEVQKELLQQFPVSSGNDHRIQETDWSSADHKPSLSLSAKNKIIHSIKKDNNLAHNHCDTKPLAGVQYSRDINELAAQPLYLMTGYYEDVNNVSAYPQSYDPQQTTNKWGGVQQNSGHFVEPPLLSNSNKLAGRSAWARKDQLITTNKIQEGIGMHLLMKMGWKPGEGLGRDSNGLIEPIMPMLKFDTKGLVSEEEKKKKSSNKSKEKFEGPDCKHPVSLLQEFCAKRKMSAPSYEIIQQTGPDHKKAFIMKVTVGGIEYQPLITSRSKKDAKALAATVCLESLRPSTESNQI